MIIVSVASARIKNGVRKVEKVSMRSSLFSYNLLSADVDYEGGTGSLLEELTGSRPLRPLPMSKFFIVTLK